MRNSKLHFLVQKYLNNTITDSELMKLESLLHYEENLRVFKETIKDEYSLKTNDIHFDPKTRLAEFKTLLTNSTNKKAIRFNTLYKYAAVAIIFISLAITFKAVNTSKSILGVITQKNIQLVLDDGTEKTLIQENIDSITTRTNIVLGYINNGKIQYIANNNAAHLAFNTLKVPYGQTFKVELSDGTKVHMNAGSELRYPVAFIKDRKREVFLKGEAFFAVAKDPNNKFIVNANELNIEVLGTRFNVSSYTEDSSIETTLEEGSVKLYPKIDEDNSIILSPNEQSVWQKNSKILQKNTVHVHEHIAWREGTLLFKKMRFSTIIKQLQRHYDVQIINANKDLNSQIFSAHFHEKEILQIMEYFSKSYGFKFNINGNTIEIE